MDCPYYNTHGDYRCEITQKYMYGTVMHDYYCFDGKYGYENCQCYKDYWNKR